MERDRRIFKIPNRELFDSDTRMLEYLDYCRCAMCGKKLQDGDEYELCALMTAEEAGSLCVPVNIVHSKCIDENMKS